MCQPHDSKCHSANCGLWGSPESRVQSPDCELRIADCRLQIEYCGRGGQGRPSGQVGQPNGCVDMRIMPQGSFGLRFPCHIGVALLLLLLLLHFYCHFHFLNTHPPTHTHPLVQITHRYACIPTHSHNIYIFGPIFRAVSCTVQLVPEGSVFIRTKCLFKEQSSLVKKISGS